MLTQRSDNILRPLLLARSVRRCLSLCNPVVALVEVVPYCAGQSLLELLGLEEIFVLWSSSLLPGDQEYLMGKEQRCDAVAHLLVGRR